MKPIMGLTRALLQSGFAVMTFDYRLLLRGGRIEEQVDDVAQALLFWADRGKEHGLAADKRTAVGLSAGGTLMLLALARIPMLYQRAASFFSVYDFTRLSGPLADLANRMLFRTDDLGKRARWSPLHVFSNAMPLTLLHGTHDTLVPFDQAEAFARARRASSLPVELLTYEGSGHGFLHPTTTPVAKQATSDLLERIEG
jgi:acetyl esterase